MALPLIKFRDPEPLQDYYNGDGKSYSVARLIDDCKDLKPFDCPIASLNVGTAIWSGESLLSLARHVQKVNDADLTKPIILDWDGCIADGRHRLIKAIIKGRKTIKAVRMTWKPEPCRVEE